MEIKLSFDTFQCNLSLDDPHKPPRVVEYTDGMSKPRMCCRRIDEIRNAQLLDASKTLNVWSFQQSPSRHVERLPRPKHDHVVNRIANAFGLDLTADTQHENI